MAKPEARAMALPTLQDCCERSENDIDGAFFLVLSFREWTEGGT
jgi:hypothetical protein